MYMLPQQTLTDFQSAPPTSGVMPVICSVPVAVLMAVIRTTVTVMVAVRTTTMETTVNTCVKTTAKCVNLKTCVQHVMRVSMVVIANKLATWGVLMMGDVTGIQEHAHVRMVTMVIPVKASAHKTVMVHAIK